MLSQDFITELSRRTTALFQSLPHASELQGDAEQKMQDLLKSAFSRLNLVSREEFDAQLATLARAEARIAALESRVAALEATQNRASAQNSAAQPDGSV